MQYTMRDHLSACVIGDHAVFLDVDADRYFRLPVDLERAFVAYTTGRDRESAASILLANSILVPSATGENALPVPIDAPMRSAQEMSEPTAGRGFTAVPEVMAALWTSRRALRTERFRDVLDRTARDRDQRCQSSPQACDPVNVRDALRFSNLFHRARAYVPIAPCCLPDSIALTRFLARRRIDSRIVFGVTCEPFSAHCWVQAGDISLNENVGYARAHTVIRVV